MSIRRTTVERGERLKVVRRMIADLQTRRSVARDAHRDTEAARLQKLIDSYRDELATLEAV